MKKKLNSIGVRSLSVLLSVLMMLAMFPLSVLAVTSEETAEGAIDAETAAMAPLVPYELVEMRTEDAKYYQMPDGTKVVAQYSSPVHRQDSEGNWQDIDNRLWSLVGDYLSSDARVKFAKKTNGSGTLFTLHEKNRKIEMALVDANKKVVGEVTNHTTEHGTEVTELQKMLTLDHLNSTILYPEILDGVDLEYVVTGNSVKENIIVREKSDAYAYAFEIKLNNLLATKSEEGDILITDKQSGEVVYRIPAGFMLDANGERSYGVEYTLSDSGNGKYLLTVTADAAWINADGRAFPVTVDPTILAHSVSSVLDLRIYQTRPDTTDVYSEIINVNRVGRMYWKLTDLPYIPSSAYISDAEFSAYTDFVTVESGKEAYEIALYPVTSSWDSTLTWNKMSQGYGSIPAAYVEYEAVKDDTVGWIHFEATPIVKSWYAGENYGLCIAPKDATALGGVSLYSNDCTTADICPQLTVTYADLKGIEDHYSVTGQDAGFAGSGMVNLAGGELMFQIPTLTTTDYLMPYTPTLHYHSSLAGRAYAWPNMMVPNYYSLTGDYGMGWNFNESVMVQTYVTEVDGSTVERELYTWVDGNGTQTQFARMASGSPVMDLNGKELMLFDTEETLTIVDVNGNKRAFQQSPLYTNGGWRLRHINDSSGNTVSFDLNSDGSVQTISLQPQGSSVIQQLQLYYNDAGAVSMVRNATSGEAVLLRYSSYATYAPSYNSSGYLRQVVRAHGLTATDNEWLALYNSNANISTSTITVDAVADYTYDTRGRLLSVTNNLSQYRVSYTYDTLGRVASVSESAGADFATAGQQITLTYGTASTTVRNSGNDDAYGTADDLLTTYNFDKCGRAINCFTTDLEGTTLYGASSVEYDEENEGEYKNNVKTAVATSSRSSNYLLNGGFESVLSQATDPLPNWSISGSVMKASNGHQSAFNAELTANSANTVTSISQQVYLPEGEYYLSLHIDTKQAKGAHVVLQATSEYSPHNVYKQISVDQYDATDGYVLIGMAFRSAPGEITDPVEDSFAASGKESFRIQIGVVHPVRTGAELTEAELAAMVTVHVDNVMLSEGTGAMEYDMVQMGHFENTGYGDTNVLPDGTWTLSGTNGVNTDTTDTLFGHVLKITQSGTATQTVYEATDDMRTEYLRGGHVSQDIYSLNLYGWAKGTVQVYDENSLFQMTLDVEYLMTDGTCQSQDPLNVVFDKGLKGWQFAGGALILSNVGLINKITLTIHYTNHTASSAGYFDSMMLVPNSADTSSYAYVDGRLTQATGGRESVWYEYGENKLVSRIISSDQTVVTYTYNDKNLLVGEVHAVYSGTYDGSSGFNLSTTPVSYTDYEYNAYALVTTQYVTGTDGKQSKTDYVYDTNATSHIFGAITQVTDIEGGVTRYFYDETNGRLQAVIEPDLTGTAYGYDGIGNLTWVTDVRYIESTNELYPIGEHWVEYTYDTVTNRLTAIDTESTTYQFTYDTFGNTAGVSVGGTRQLASYTYNSNNGKLNTMTYGNGDQVQYVYDALDRISEVWYNTGTDGAMEKVYTYAYDGAGRLYSVQDHTCDQAELYEYDIAGRLTKSYVCELSTTANADPVNLNATRVQYDENSRVATVVHSFDYPWSEVTRAELLAYEYGYDARGNLGSMIFDTAWNQELVTVGITYDGMNRVDTRTLELETSAGDMVTYRVSYEYTQYTDADQSQYEASRVRGYTSTIGTTESEYILAYDANGNVTGIRTGVVSYRYKYDPLDQLIREDNPSLNKTYTYEYDTAGNLVSKKTYTYEVYDDGELGTPESTVTYTYGNATWGDLLTAWNGNAITYDTVGNPTRIASSSTSGYDLTWQGRQLVSYTGYGSYTGVTTFSYNNEGIRTSKTFNGVKHEYILNGSQIVGEKSNTYAAIYLYDELGSPMGLGVRLNGDPANAYEYYFFEKNLQGDVVGLYRFDGTKIGTYVYDAWGNCTVRSNVVLNSQDGQILAFLNPFRYRGYFFDVETGLYYLQSRYYNPQWGRFINPDAWDVIGATPMALTDKNLYAYCDNNPITRVDGDGEFWNWLVGTVVGAVGGAISAAIEGKTGTEFWASVASGAASGFVAGVVADVMVITGGSAATVTAISAIGNGIASGTGSIVEDVIVDGEVNGVDVVVAAAIGTAVGTLTGVMEGPMIGMKKDIASRAGKKTLERGITFGYAAKRTVIREAQKLGSSFVKEGISNFTFWFTEYVFNGAMGW